MNCDMTRSIDEINCSPPKATGWRRRRRPRVADRKITAKAIVHQKCRAPCVYAKVLKAADARGAE
eukprot:15470745-Alexandrium_andersonii.AAC.1